MKHIVILGLMGTGKSTTAAALANAKDMNWHDSDHDIQTLFGQPGKAVAENLGVDELHRLESAVLLGRLADAVPAVISAAAWVVEDPRCRAALARRAHVVVLHAPIDEILRRMATGGHRRPILKAELIALAERRAPLFTSVSDVDLEATLTTEQLVTHISASVTFDQLPVETHDVEPA